MVTTALKQDTLTILSHHTLQITNLTIQNTSATVKLKSSLVSVYHY